MKNESRIRLEELLAMLSDDSITKKEFNELDEILRDHPEARRIYCDYLAVDDRLASGEVLFEEVERAKARTGLPIKGWLPWAAAAALVFTGVLFSHLFREQPFDSSETARSTSPENAVPERIMKDWPCSDMSVTCGGPPSNAPSDISMN